MHTNTYDYAASYGSDAEAKYGTQANDKTREHREEFVSTYYETEHPWCACTPRPVNVPCSWDIS